FDTMTITQVQDQAAHLQHNQQGPLSKQYDSGAKVVQFQDHVYFLDTTTRQLKHYDGYQTVTPLLDEVVGLNFEYYGDPQPAVMLDGLGGLKNNTVTYGGKPTLLNSASPPAGYYGVYQNCTITTSGVTPTWTQTPRLATLGAAG